MPRALDDDDYHSLMAILETNNNFILRKKSSLSEESVYRLLQSGKYSFDKFVSLISGDIIYTQTYTHSQHSCYTYTLLFISILKSDLRFNYA